MFIIVIYDKTKRKIYFYRDSVGEKPLYYYLENNSLVFSSELKALANEKKLAKTLNNESIKDYLINGYILEPKTIFNEIYKIPACSLTSYDLNSNEFVSKEYWNEYFYINSNKNINDFKKNYKNYFKDVYNSDFAIAIAYSSGIDSNFIAHSCPNGIKCTLFHVCFKGYEKYDEREDAIIFQKFII